MSEKLTLNALTRAIRSLEEVLAQPKSMIVRDATIQRFEYTYELAQRLMKRYLESKFSSEEIDALPRKEILRYARENGLIENIEGWFEYHQARNQTSHAYDEEIAEQVYAVATKFLPDVKAFLDRLGERI